MEKNINYYIEKYGMKDVSKVYDHVKTYEDLLITNIAFLNGKMKATFYHGDEFGAGTGDTHVIAAKTLIDLHKNRIFTVDGQINTINKADPSKPEEWSLEQKSYVMTYLEEELMDKLLPGLMNDSRIVIQVAYPDKIRNIDTFGKDARSTYNKKLKKNLIYYNVTLTYNNKERDEFTNLFREDYKELSIHTFGGVNKEYPNVYKIGRSKCILNVAVKQYGYYKSADEILLEHVRSLH